MQDIWRLLFCSSQVSNSLDNCQMNLPASSLSASVGNGTYVSSDATAEHVLLCGKEDSHIIEMGAIVPFVTSNLKAKWIPNSFAAVFTPG